MADLLSLWLAETAVDRCSELRLVDGALHEVLARPDTLVLDISQEHVLGRPGALLRPTSGEEPPESCMVLGRLGSSGRGTVASEEPGPYVVGRIVSSDTPGLTPVREIAMDCDPVESTLLGTAVALAKHHARAPHCAACGSRTTPIGTGWVRRCPACGADTYPRTDPVVLFSVVSQDGSRIALSRGPSWPEGRFSVQAGFVDACEHPAETVVREAWEELGVRATDVEQVGIQPWPFNLQVILAYTCRTADTTLTPQEGEIAEAMWVTRDELRGLLDSNTIQVPGRYATGRALIEHFLAASVPSEGSDLSRSPDR